VHQPKSGIIVFVGCAAYVGSLGDDAVGPHGERGGVIELGVVGDRDQIFADEIPWRPDTGFGVELAGGPEVRAEKPEQQSSPREEWPWRKAKEESVAEVPQKARGAVAQGECWQFQRIGSGV